MGCNLFITESARAPGLGRPIHHCQTMALCHALGVKIMVIYSACSDVCVPLIDDGRFRCSDLLAMASHMLGLCFNVATLNYHFGAR